MADNPPPLTDPQAPSKTASPSAPSRRALGRGLGALIPGADTAPDAGVIEVQIDHITPNSLQPRVGFAPEALAELEASIREHGVLQPVLLRPAPSRPGQYELVAGERRWRAAASAGLRSVPAIIRQLDDRGALEAALVENLQREDLNPLERARAYQRLQDTFGLTQEDIARRVGRSQPAVANSIRLLALPGEVQASLEAGRIMEGHARALLQIGNRQRLLETWRSVETRGLSVRETEAAARRAGISRGIRSASRGIAKDLNIIQQQLTDVLGAPVHLVVRKNGSGELRIAFSSQEDLDRLLEVLRGARPR